MLDAWMVMWHVCLTHGDSFHVELLGVSGHPTLTKSSPWTRHNMDQYNSGKVTDKPRLIA